MSIELKAFCSFNHNGVVIIKNKNIKTAGMITLVLLFCSTNLSAHLSASRARLFLQSLISESHDLVQFVLPEEYELSKRLSITYEDIQFKFLLSYDIDREIKRKIVTQQLRYDFQATDMDSVFSKLDVVIPENGYHKSYFFKEGFLVSPIHYYTRDWIKMESDHYAFIVSDSLYLSRHCVQNLEKFFREMSAVLKLNTEKVNLIGERKIYYVLCQDEEEIELLTGFKARGMYNLAYDYVITTFNCHYHELVHLLMNYKLHDLPLYTHPFLQEGFAVAFGGRGGKEPEVILRVGLFLQKTGILEYPSLLTKQGFFAVDRSLSYPVCGLYNHFLVMAIGIDRYVELYRKFSGAAPEIDEMRIHAHELPVIHVWNDFLDSLQQASLIDFNFVETNCIFSDSSSSIYQDEGRYHFSIRDTFLIHPHHSSGNYRSNKFDLLFRNREYRGEKYCIIANSDEIAIYNLYTNNLIANYVRSFAIPPEPVPRRNGHFCFSVKRGVFDEDLRDIFFTANK